MGQRPATCPDCTSSAQRLLKRAHPRSRVAVPSLSQIFQRESALSAKAEIPSAFRRKFSRFELPKSPSHTGRFFRETQPPLFVFVLHSKFRFPFSQSAFFERRGEQPPSHGVPSFFQIFGTFRPVSAQKAALPSLREGLRCRCSKKLSAYGVTSSVSVFSIAS